MPTTVRIDDDLLLALKEQAHRQNTSLDKLLNQTLCAGIKASHQPNAQKAYYKEKTYKMGILQANLDKALALAANLEDEEIVKKMMLIHGYI
jgi:hypothetical protein